MSSLNTKKILLLGDSLSAGFPYKEIDEYQFVNLAVNGDETVDLLNRLPYIRFKNIDIVIIEIGINDLLREHLKIIDRSTKQILNNITSILNYILEKMLLPNIFLVSLYPVNHHEKYVKLEEIDLINSKILDFNEELRTVAKAKNVHYIDMYHVLQKNERLPSSLTNDGIHLNSVGYQIVYKKLQIVLKN